MKFDFYKHVELDEEVKELKELFEEHNIKYEFSSASTIIDSTIVGQGMFAKYTLKLQQKDFEKANSVIENHINKKDIDIENFQHLKALNNDELIEILVKPSEWSFESVLAAKHFLKSRGVDISDKDIDKMKQSHYSEIRKGKEVPLTTQILYFVAIILGFYLSIIFTIAGIGMGYYYAYGHALDHNGIKYYIYDKKARKNGKLILYGGVIAFVIQLFLLFMVDVF